jgi:hypothetical protein
MNVSASWAILFDGYRKRLGDPNLPYLHKPCGQLSPPHVCRSRYILYILLIGLLDNYELHQEWTVIVHHRGYFRIWSSSCKSVHNRSNISYTQVNTRTHTQPGIRGARRLAPLATPHNVCIETHRSLRHYAFPGTRASCVRAPHAPAVYPIGIHRAAYSTADGRLIRQYTPASYVSHMSRIVALFWSPQKKPHSSEGVHFWQIDSTYLQLTS